MGRYLDLAERAIREGVQRAALRTEAAIPQREISTAIPAGAVLLAPRYDGTGKPLAGVPRCWCCAALWVLDRVRESEGETIAWLEPGCACLDTPQALACCGLCVEHCHGRKRDGKAEAEPITRPT